MNAHLKYILLLTIFVIAFIPCCKRSDDIALQELVVNHNNYIEYIEKVREGYGINNPLTDKEHLTDLLTFIQADSIKRKYYKNNEVVWLFDIAMIQLMNSEYLGCFRKFNKYIKISQDCVRPFFQIGIKTLYLHEHSGKYVLENSLRRLGERNNPSLLKTYQSILFAKIMQDTYVAITINKRINKNIIKSTEYARAYEMYLTVKNRYEMHPEFFLDDQVFLEMVPPKFLASVEARNPLSNKEIDFLIEYYTYTLTHDYQKAAFYADMKDPDNIGGNDPEYILSRIMIAYLKTGRYRDVVALYERNKHKIRERRLSEYYIPLWLGAAHAGLGELDQAKEYLRLALDITTLEDGYHVSYDQKGCILFVIFNLVFFTEEYEVFERLGRYAEIEKIVEASMARFKHLKQFQ